MSKAPNRKGLEEVPSKVLVLWEEGHTAFPCMKRKSVEKREKTEEKAMFAFGKQSSNIEDYMSEDSEGIDIGL